MIPARFDAFSAAYIAAVAAWLERVNFYPLRLNESADDYAVRTSLDYLTEVQAHGVGGANLYANLAALKESCQTIGVLPDELQHYLEGA